MTRIVFAAVGIVCFVMTAFANKPSRDWPRWRGPKADVDGVDSDGAKFRVGSPQWHNARCVAVLAYVDVRRVAGQVSVGGVSGDRTETPGSLGETGSAGPCGEPPAYCRDAGHFVEVIGLQVLSGVSSGIPESADA